jgi:hypothetical protein
MATKNNPSKKRFKPSLLPKILTIRHCQVTLRRLSARAQGPEAVEWPKNSTWSSANTLGTSTGNHQKRWQKVMTSQYLTHAWLEILWNIPCQMSKREHGTLPAKEDSVSRVFRPHQCRLQKPAGQLPKNICRKESACFSALGCTKQARTLDVWLQEGIWLNQGSSSYHPPMFQPLLARFARLAPSLLGTISIRAGYNATNHPFFMR